MGGGVTVKALDYSSGGDWFESVHKSVNKFMLI